MKARLFLAFGGFTLCLLGLVFLFFTSAVVRALGGSTDAAHYFNLTFLRLFAAAMLGVGGRSLLASVST